MFGVSLCDVCGWSATVNNTAAARADFTGTPTHANFFVFVFYFRFTSKLSKMMSSDTPLNTCDPIYGPSPAIRGDYLHPRDDSLQGKAVMIAAAGDSITGSWCLKASQHMAISSRQKAWQ